MKKDKGTKIIASVTVIAGLLVIGGILFTLKKTDPTGADQGEETKPEETAVTVVEVAGSLPEITPEPEVIIPVIDATMPAEKEGGEQPIQEEPEKPKEPDTPPELKEGEDLTNPDKEPEYEEEPKPTEKPNDTVVTMQPTDEQHPGQIYVPGFGWVEDIGPGHGIDATDIYMNGNKIGDM